MKRDWLLYALLFGGGYLVWKKLSGSVGDARDKTASAISQTVFDVFHPSLSPEEFNKPTIVDPVNGKCPSGYTLRNGLHGPYCARVS